MGIFDWKHWVVILIVVVLVFGTKRLKNLGSDLGETIKGFRKAMHTEDEQAPDAKPEPTQAPVQETHRAPQASQPTTIDVQAQKVEDSVRKD